MNTPNQKIHSESRFKQPLLFEGIKASINANRKISPTDIDALLDYNGDAFIYFEVKKKNKGMTTGQQWALENLVKANAHGGRYSIVVLCEHAVNNSNDAVYLKDCKPIKYFEYKECKWVDIDFSLSTNEFIKCFEETISLI